MIERGIHYSTGSLGTARHRDPLCPRLKGRTAYRRVDSDTNEFIFDQKWCATCSPDDRARSDASREQLRRSVADAGAGRRAHIGRVIRS